jgi:signal peptidase I
LEILVVAVAVAMAFRAYFVQPFKIPTGSMQPTLYGIHSRPAEKEGITDRMPLKAAKWLFLGEWYREVMVKAPGQLSQGIDAGPDSPSVRYYYVGPIRYGLPKDAKLNYEPGTYLSVGNILWSGIVTAGDHVFVDKVRWNFCRPKRGGVMVFSTDGIPMLMQGTHYIKRMVGLPKDEISISAPYLIVNGRKLMEPESVAKIAEKIPPYDKPPYGFGYIPPLNTTGGLLRTPGEVLALREHTYFGLGDNTGNSFDGRYWGTVPEHNLVGPAWLVYWPFSVRWGVAR